MRVVVDLTRCQGYANCVSSAPEIFDLSDSGHVVVLRQPRPEDESAARTAAGLCPVTAIEILED